MEDRLYKRTVASLYTYVYHPANQELSPLPPLSHVKKQLLEELRLAESAKSDKRPTYTLEIPVENVAMLFSRVESYLQQEERAERFQQSPSRLRTLQGRQWEATHQPLRPSLSELSFLFQLSCTLVEKRAMSPVVASRLLRPRWPHWLLYKEPSGTVYHNFIRKSLLAWLSEAVRYTNAMNQKGSDPAPGDEEEEARMRYYLTPKDARAVLDNLCHTLRGEEASTLAGPLACIAILDLEEVEAPEALISLLWSVQTTGAHAPQSFWQTVFDRILSLNETCTQLASPTAEAKEEEEDAEDDVSDLVPPAKHFRLRRSDAGHVFSGLTTRQIYRLVAVLKREKWCGSVAAMHDLVDAALKNIAFETEAGNYTTLSAAASSSAVGAGSKQALSKREVQERVRLVADLSWDELMELLTISGDLEIPFHISAEKVTEHLLLPMLRFLHGADLLALLKVIRQTKCRAPLLLSEFTYIIAQQKPTSPYIYPITHSMIKVLLHEPSLMLFTRSGEEVASTFAAEHAPEEMPAVELINYFFDLIQLFHTKVRPKELADLGDTLYGLSRQSQYLHLSLGDKARRLFDSALCRQMERLLQTEVTPPTFATRLLECTIVLGMRADQKPSNAAQYPHTQALLRTRNAAVAKEERYRASRRDFLVGVADDDLGHVDMDETGNDPVVKVRWESLSEQQLPTVPKAALDVYKELIYMFERMTVVKAVVTDVDKERFHEVLHRTGLYNIFLGAKLFKNAHFDQESETSVDGTTVIEARLPTWIETSVSSIIKRKIGQLYQHNMVLKSSSSNKKEVVEEFLHVLGQIHCDAEKVRHFKRCVTDSPFRMAKQKRDVWVFLCDLTQFFGSEQDKQEVQSILSNTLF